MSWFSEEGNTHDVIMNNDNCKNHSNNYILHNLYVWINTRSSAIGRWVYPPLRVRLPGSGGRTPIWRLLDKATPVERRHTAEGRPGPIGSTASRATYVCQPESHKHVIHELGQRWEQELPCRAAKRRGAAMQPPLSPTQNRCGSRMITSRLRLPLKTTRGRATILHRRVAQRTWASVGPANRVRAT